MGFRALRVGTRSRRARSSRGRARCKTGGSNKKLKPQNITEIVRLSIVFVWQQILHFESRLAEDDGAGGTDGLDSLCLSFFLFRSPIGQIGDQIVHVLRGQIRAPDDSQSCNFEARTSAWWCVAYAAPLNFTRRWRNADARDGISIRMRSENINKQLTTEKGFSFLKRVFKAWETVPFHLLSLYSPAST